MKKIKKFFCALALLFRNPFLLNIIISDSDYYKKRFFKKYKKSAGLPQIDILDIEPCLNIVIEPYAFLEGGSTPLDLCLLKILSKRFKIRNYLEIGTWRGESAAIVAPYVDACYTLNLSDEHLKQLKKSDNYIQSQAFFSKGIENIKHIKGDSQLFDFSSTGVEFDMVFVDGDHNYEAVKRDTETAFKIIQPDKGIIVWHDYMVGAETVRWDVLHAIFEGCPPDKHQHIYHVSNTLCAVYIPDANILSKEFVPFQLPDKWFSVTINAKKNTDDN